MKRFFPSLIFIGVAAASTDVVASSFAGKRHEASDILSIVLDKLLDLSKAYAVIEAKIGPLLAEHTPTHLRTLQTSDLLAGFGDIAASLNGPNWTPQTTLDDFRRAFCSQKQAAKDAVSGLLTSAAETVQLPPLDDVIDAIWPCLCTEMSLSDAAYAAFANALLANPQDTSNIIAQLKLVIPLIMGSKGVCGSSCQTGVAKFIEWAISAGQALLGLEEVRAATPWVPSLSAGLGGTGSDFMTCFCSGVKWGKFAALIDDDTPAILQFVLELLGGQESVLLQLATDTYRGYLAGLSKFAQFFASGDGTCSGTGCQALWQKVLKYGLDTFKGLLNGVDGIALPANVVGALMPEPLLECTCGGTLDYAPMMQGLAFTVSQNIGILFGPPSAPPPTMPEGTGSTSETTSTSTATSTSVIGGVIAGINIEQTRPLQAGVLSSVFSPYFLCSSAACKTLTSSVMDLVGALGQTLEADTPERDALSFSAIDWCPTEAGAAGVVIEQDLVIGGTVDEFTPVLQTALKQGVVDEINEAIGTDSFVKLTPAQVKLTITPGSVNVAVAVTVATPALVTGVSQGMTAIAAAPASTLTSKFGVTVESVAPPKAPVTQAVVVSDLSKKGGGAVAIIGTLLICYFCRSRKPKKSQPQMPASQANQPQAVPMAVPMATAIPLSKFCTKCGTKATGAYCTKCGIALDGSMNA